MGQATAEPSAKDGHFRVSYQDIHLTIGKTAERIKAEFDPDIMIAIGGGGTRRNIPIQAIGLSLYEELPDIDKNSRIAQAEKIGKEVVRTQWLDFSTLGNRPLLGRRILIVDEVDDSRTTLGFAVSELKKDIEDQLSKLSEDKRASIPKTELAIFVVHNKLKEKRGSIPPEVKYFSGADIPDVWCDYPWESQDIIAHDKLVAEQKSLGLFSEFTVKP